MWVSVSESHSGPCRCIWEPGEIAQGMPDIQKPSFASLKVQNTSEKVSTKARQVSGNLGFSREGQVVASVPWRRVG